MDDLDLIRCNNTYIPTSEQYLEALGSFGSSILIIGGLVTLGLFILFFEQVVYTNQTAHSSCKRHIYWIASVFPMMTLMSLIALLIPRAHNVCLSVKMIYMSIGISHFTDLTMVLFGGEELVVERGQDDTFNLRLSPLCCCCKCLPRPPVTKYSLRLVVLLTDQLPFIQAIYYVMVLILLAADNITLGDVNPGGAYLWLNLIKLASVLFGVYGFMILSSFSHGYLDDFQYGKKSRSIRLLVLVTNMQLLAFNIMANYNAFPCIPPYVPPAVYKQTVDNSLYLLEMMILGPYTYWQYHDLGFSSPIAHLPLHNSSRSSSLSYSSRGSSASSQDEDSKASTASTAVTNSSGASSDSRDASNSTNNKGGDGSGGNEMNMKENGAENVDCEKGDAIITTQVTSIVASALNSNNGSNSSNCRVTSTGDGLFPSSGGMRDSKTQGTSILGSDLTSNNGSTRSSGSSSNRKTSTRTHHFASSDSNKESRTRKDAISSTRDSALASSDRAKGIKTSKRERTSKEKTSTATNLGSSNDKASASSRSKSSSSRSRSRDGSSSRASSSGKKKGENASRKSKSAKNSSKHKSRKITTTFYSLNEVIENTTSKDKNTKNNYDVTTTFSTTDKSNGRIFNSPTKKTINSFAFSPGMLNRAISLSQPNMKGRSEYERFY